MQLGAWQLDTVSGGRFRLDGGAMFGVVPKPLWQRAQPADELNRIRMATNCVLARNGRHTVLIDTGYGGKESPSACERFALEPGEPLLASLAALGVEPGQVDTVILSHLHFDHAGGCTRRDLQGQLRPTFPKARHFVQRGEWQAAISGAPELRGSYPLENLLPLEQAGQLELLDGDVEILPGLRAHVTGGHTAAHQAVVLSSGGETAVYLGDLCPMRAHLRRHWHMAYDLFPLDTRRIKPELLGRAAGAGWLIMWDHDPDVAAGKLARDPHGEFQVIETFERL